MNASVSGFLVSIEDKELQEIAISSRFIERKNSSLKAKLINFEGNLFRFQWSDGNQEDRLSWLKEVSANCSENISSTGTNEDEILSLFCQSGALSESYIKSQKGMSKDFLSALELSSEEEPWLYRLTDTNSDSDRKAFASAFQSGDNCWSIIDIVSDRYNEDAKMSKSFFPRFISSFKDFASSLSPCPLVLISWVEDHGYYRSFEKHILDKDFKHYMQSCNMHYTRNSSPDLCTQTDLNLCTRVDPADFKKIEETLQQIPKGLHSFTSAFDFTINRFGSSKLRAMFDGAELPFKRQYWLIKEGDSNFSLCAYSGSRRI